METISLASQTDDNCSDEVAPSAAVWTELEREYNAMNAESQALVAGATANAAGNKYEEAAFRYDIIVKKYGKKDFLGRKSGGSGASIINVSAAGTMTTAIVTTASFGALAAAGVFFVRKKKQF